MRSSETLLKQAGGRPYDQVMLIDGNDDRGIDVGIMTRGRYKLVGIESHVDDRAGGERIFSRDCAVYTVKTPKGNEVVILVNHFKSKMMGGDAKRKRQAGRR